MQQSRLLGAWVGVLVTTLVALFIIKYFNISYPVSVRTSQVSSELSVVGEGSVDAKPDSATVMGGFSVQNAATVQAAKGQIDAVSQKLVENLTQLGIAKTDIQTTNYSLNPNYPVLDGTAPTAQLIGGSVSYTITVKNIDMVNQVINAVTDAGANQIGNVSYSVSNPEKYREQARDQAIANAKSQAQKLASQLGIRLGNIDNIVENSPQTPGPIPYAMNSLALGGGAKSTPDLQPGTQTVNSTVTLYFEKN